MHTIAEEGSCDARAKRPRLHDSMRDRTGAHWLPHLAALLLVWASLVPPVVVQGSSAQPERFYVSTHGDDARGDGSQTLPWRTISHALSAVRDGSTILVRPGTYFGRVRLRGTFEQGVIIRSEHPYQARLRHDATVVTCFYGQGITLEGFDIAHTGPGSGALVVQIQDLIGEPGGDARVSGIVLRDNLLHDSYNNDILKVNNGAEDVRIEGNLFYNQSGPDEHIDINSVSNVIIQDNLFFNDFAGSARENHNNTSSYIVIKDSNAGYDGLIGSRRIIVRRNIFLNWQGSSGHNFLLIGEDGQPYLEAQEVLVENNLLLGNAANVMRAPFGVKGGGDILFRNNTIVGDLPSMAYAMRLNTEGANPPNENIQFHNNIWSDPTGSMGAENPDRANDFSDTPLGETVSFSLLNNLYWNGSAAIPSDPAELINVSDDRAALIGDPALPNLSAVPLPRWDPQLGRFADGSSSIRASFVQLVERYGTPRPGSFALGAADPSRSPSEDILGRARPESGGVDVGAVQAGSALQGDLNLDGAVDRTDLQLMVETLLGDKAGLELRDRADVDQNGSLDARDVQWIINLLLAD